MPQPGSIAKAGAEAGVGEPAGGALVVKLALSAGAWRRLSRCHGTARGLALADLRAAGCAVIPRPDVASLPDSHPCDHGIAGFGRDSQGRRQPCHDSGRPCLSWHCGRRQCF